MSIELRVARCELRGARYALRDARFGFRGTGSEIRVAGCGLRAKRIGHGAQSRAIIRMKTQCYFLDIYISLTWQRGNAVKSQFTNAD